MNRKGFTLIELLIVVVIIGILAAIAIPKFSNTKEKALVSGMKSDLRNLASAEEAYYADNTQYGSLAALQATPYSFKLSGINAGTSGGDPTSYALTITNTGVTSYTNCHISGNSNGAADEGVPTCS